MAKTVNMLAGFLALSACFAAESAHTCSCQPISPAEGFARAQYVFVGKVVEGGTHTWRVEVDRVWKGKETLPRTARLMDVYAMMDCAFYFKEGERYLFFAIVAKGPRDVFFHPQVCNWTSPLQSKRVVTTDGASVWLEELIIREYGPGEQPEGERASERLP
jgi:hypothetical protein